MSEIVRIKVDVEEAKALASLQALKSLCDQLNKTPVVIKIGAGNGSGGGLEGYTTQLNNLNTATQNLQGTLRNTKTTVVGTANSNGEITNATKTVRVYNDELGRTVKLTETIKKDGSKVFTASDSTNFEKAAKATEKAAKEQAGYNKNVETGSKLNNVLGDSLGNIAVKMAAWQIMGTAVSTAIGAVRDGLETIKQVDSELATVRKVTGMSIEESEALGERAYDVAAKYGMNPAEYLQNVGTFARAGYGEMAEGLGELAIKTQLVGDTDAETAAQFLLSADAAWKYKGNMEELSLVLDKANEIDNNYATSIEKIAEGIPIVGNVAAMAGMTYDETVAALGTITATTQETGTKAATALRALILNILGDTTTEIEEGVTASAESVESMGQILAKYAPEAVAAAEATGQLIDPMEAIEALSKAAKDGLLTEMDLMELVSGLGGKLRTNQLWALIENFDTYKQMLEDMEGAAGSADDEIANMLETWEKKTETLRTTWAKFLTNFADTGLVKEFLDTATAGIETLDSLVGKLDPVLENVFSEASAVLEDFRFAMDFIEQIIAKLNGEEVEIKFTAPTYESLKAKFDQIEGEISKEDVKRIVFEEFGFQQVWFKVQELIALARNPIRFVAQAVVGGISSYFGGGGNDYSYVKSGNKVAARAKGDRNFKGGKALVNDGKPVNGSAAELILEGDEAYIANGGEPAVVQLPPGAQILDAETTQKALKGGSFSGRIPRFAGGWLSNVWSGVKAVAQDLLNIANTGSYGSQSQVSQWAAETSAPKSTTHKSSSGRVHGGYQGSFADTSYSYSEPGYPQPTESYSYAPTPSYSEPSYSYGSGYYSDPGYPQPSFSYGTSYDDYGGYYGGYSGYSPSYGEYSGYTDYGGFGGGYSDFGSTGMDALEQTDPVEELGKEISEALRNLDEQIRLAQNQSDTGRETALYSQGMSSIDSYIARYRALGLGDSSTEILELQNRRYSYEDAQASAPVKNLEDKISKFLTNLEEQIELAQNKEDAEEVARLQQEAVDGIAGFVKEFNALGYNDKSTEVLELLNESYRYQKDILEAEENVLKELQQALSKQLDHLDAQIQLARNQENTAREQELTNKAIEMISEQIKELRQKGFAEDSKEIVDLKNTAFGYANNLVGGIVSIWDAASAAVDAADRFSQLEEEIAEKEKEIENLKNQRTVRFYNSRIGQWEWIANEAEIERAAEELAGSTEALKQLELEKSVLLAEEIINKYLSDSISRGDYDSAAAMKELGAISGGVENLITGTVAGSSGSGGIVDNSTNYNIGGIRLTEEQASQMTVKQLADRLRDLNLTE